MEIKRLEDKAADYDVFSEIYAYFEQEPYYEIWNDQKKRRLYLFYLEYGAIFCYENSGIIANVYHQEKGRYRKIYLPYDSWGKVYNIGDIMVKRQQRKQGIGSSLLESAIDDAQTQDFDLMITRTNLTNSMFEPLLLKKDFKVLKDTNETIIQTCSSLRQSGQIETDKRKFLIKKLERRKTNEFN